MSLADSPSPSASPTSLYTDTPPAPLKLPLLPLLPPAPAPAASSSETMLMDMLTSPPPADREIIEGVPPGVAAPPAPLILKLLLLSLPAAKPRRPLCGVIKFRSPVFEEAFLELPCWRASRVLWISRSTARASSFNCTRTVGWASIRTGVTPWGGKDENTERKKRQYTKKDSKYYFVGKKRVIKYK